MSDRFRDLEKPQPLRRRDVVLMATVSSFEDLRHPTRSELRQFAELFKPLFEASTDEARRQAVAALSQNPNVPQPVALFVASQPISIAAPFLMSSPCLDDETLMLVARTQGEAHARAIVRRENLSPTVVDALVGLRHTRPAAPPAAAGEPAPPAPVAPQPPAGRPVKEERLRTDLRNLVRHVNRPDGDRLGLRTLSTLQEALLIRFARTRETVHFATALADALSASRWLAERILLDISGKQLATTLVGTGMAAADATFILERLYPHLAEPDGQVSRADRLIASLDPDRCGERVEAWRRADSYTFAQERAAEPDPLVAEAYPLPNERRMARRIR
ncbi:DUF2336 domain-containing protein [Rhizobiaceae bacterium BDR2-2]|uniref:DUF2336 domain-containing protein n=1 Tax=Ectorhizobium quercum TaxID=2965071 RepID=A0AAE3SWX7_9HYPH|nr:DUF2336 domain-containing protein [Ectorhizobium quercum]MCX8998484.1 DUF2336 domain-containing protein [Ectorhizobium quercum]